MLCERSILLALYQQYDQLCFTHKIKLRPVTINLFDSQTKWGQFNFNTRTISLSRRLVIDHPWQFVTGVLHHEMAHQYMADHYPEKMMSEKPHGELFHDICKKIGLPAHFASSGIDAMEKNLDWRDDAQDQESSKILDKAKKLLNLASSTNEHEAHLAMERIREIYAKYNISHFNQHQMFVHLILTLNKERTNSWEQRILTILIEHFFVKALTLKQFNVQLKKYVHAVEIIGTRENVLMAEYVYYFLLQQLDLLIKNSTSTISNKASFRLGVLEGFDKKLSTPESEVVKSALMIYKKDPALENYLDQAYPRLRHQRGRSVSIDKSSFHAGETAGRSLNLNKPITQDRGFHGLLLKSRD